MQTYEGQPVLTWWQGRIPPQGFGEGEEFVDNSSYQTILRVAGGNGMPADLHEFRIDSANDTALLTVFDPIYCNLSERRRPGRRGGDRQPLPGNGPEDASGPARVASGRPRPPLALGRAGQRGDDPVAV